MNEDAASDVQISSMNPDFLEALKVFEKSLACVLDNIHNVACLRLQFSPHDNEYVS